MKMLLILPLMLTLVLAFSPIKEVTCPSPSNVHKSSSGPCSIGFDWDDTAPSYQVWWQKAGSLPSQVFYAETSEYLFTGLLAGDYHFFFRSVCEGGELSNIIVIEETVVQ